METLLKSNTLHSGNYKVNLEIAKSLTPFQTPQEFHTFINYMAGIQYLESKGLKITSTPRQIKNGTIQIMDPLTKRIFAITKVGYIRTYTTNQYFGKGTYQLNPKNTHSPIGYSQSRILFPLEYNYMAILLFKSIKRIRKNK
jgi:hypothetical protein